MAQAGLRVSDEDLPHRRSMCKRLGVWGCYGDLWWIWFEKGLERVASGEERDLEGRYAYRWKGGSSHLRERDRFVNENYLIDLICRRLFVSLNLYLAPSHFKIPLPDRRETVAHRHR